MILTSIIGVISCSNKNGQTYYDGDEFTAQTEEGVEMVFKVISAEDKTVQVGTNDDFSGSNRAIDRKYKGKVTIPQEINGYKVTCIAPAAFYLCHLSKVILPEGLKEIKDNAFGICNELREIQLPNSLTSIGQRAFAGCSKMTALNIPRNVDYIHDEICTARYVVSISVDKDNKVYDSRNNCNAIIETKTNTLIQGCKTTEIPEGVTVIGEDAFSDCGISYIKLPSSLLTIDEGAFWNCGLTNIQIPQNVCKISETAFDNNGKTVEKIHVDEDNKFYDSRNNCNAIIETSTNKLIIGCKNTVIPVNIKTIAKKAFVNCEFTSIKIPSSVREIDDNAFDNCKYLGTIILSEGLEEIGSEAFTDCSSLKSVTIPSTVHIIGKGVLEDCPALEKISVSSGNSRFDSRNNCNAIICTNTNSLRAACKNTVIPDDVVTIEEDAFTGTGVSHIIIPRNVTEIREHALGEVKIVKSLIVEPYPVPAISHSDIDTLYVPNGTKEKYENTKGWNKAKNIVELGD